MMLEHELHMVVVKIWKNTANQLGVGVGHTFGATGTDDLNMW